MRIILPEELQVLTETIDGVKYTYLIKRIFVETGDGFQEVNELPSDETVDFEICFEPIMKGYAKYMEVNGEILKNPSYDEHMLDVLHDF